VTSYTVLPREDEPDITIPYIFVQANFEGVATLLTLVVVPCLCSLQNDIKKRQAAKRKK
jgi:multidrug efflux pump subunit AcrB